MTNLRKVLVKCWREIRSIFLEVQKRCKRIEMAHASQLFLEIWLTNNSYKYYLKHLLGLRQYAWWFMCIALFSPYHNPMKQEVRVYSFRDEETEAQTSYYSKLSVSKQNPNCHSDSRAHA